MKQESTFVMVLSLFVVCALSALGLSYLYVNTKPRIEQNKLLKENSLKKHLLEYADKFVTKNINGLTFEEGYDKNGRLVGFILGSKCNGYGGEIEYIVAISTYLPFKILSVKILSHKETPGLGANLTKEKFITQFIDKNAQELFLKRDNSNGAIDSITGATITSRAITNSLRNLLVKEELVNLIPTTMEENNKPVKQHVKKNIKQQAEQQEQTTKEPQQMIIPQSTQEQ